MVLAAMSTPEVDEAVKSSLELYKKLDWKGLSYSDRIFLGDALILASHYVEGCEVVSHAAEEVWQFNDGYGKWLAWQAGWGAWMAGDDSKYNEIFSRVLSDSEGKPLERSAWEYGQWISAYFLDKVTQTEFMKYCSGDNAKLDDPHFFHGEKLLRAKEYDKALRAYAVCISAGEKAGDAFPANWAKWRTKQIQELRKKE